MFHTCCCVVAHCPGDPEAIKSVRMVLPLMPAVVVCGHHLTKARTALQEDLGEVVLARLEAQQGEALETTLLGLRVHTGGRVLLNPKGRQVHT